jgi:hypothetical protein
MRLARRAGSCAAARPRSGWDRWPSLRLGPAASSRRGRIQRGIQRAFMVSGTTTLSTSAIYDWTMRDRNTGWQRMQRRSVWRALHQVADRVGRADTPGKPWIWRLRNSDLPADATQVTDIAGNTSDAE